MISQNDQRSYDRHEARAASVSEEGASDSDYEDCESFRDASMFGSPERALPRQPSVILRDGRRVRRSITMTSLRTRSERIDIEEETDTRPRSSASRLLSAFLSPVTFVWGSLTAPQNHGLVKCVLAYFIASLAVFVPQFSEFLGHGDGKHFVATCTVYFHPSRSMGSMIQATIYALMALSWAVLISVSSMATAIGFNQIDHRSLGHAVVLLVYVCGGVGFIGYWKQRMGDPTVGVAASMASMVVFFNITREGSIQLGQLSLRKVLQYFFIVILGLFISNVVNYILWPVSADHNLKRDMFKSTSQFSQFLSLVTRRFLLQSRSDSLEKSFAEAVKENQTVFASLQKNLKESQYEYYLRGRETEYDLLARITKSMKNLAQHLNGLKSSCDAQMNLLPETSHLYRDSELDFNPGTTLSQAGSDASTSTAQDLRSSALVRAFIYHLGPPMKSLAYTTKQALKEMPFDKNNMVNMPSQLFVNIDRAISLYTETRDSALIELYQHRSSTNDKNLDEIADREEIAASMDYFSYSLLQFVNETRELMYCLKDLEAYQVTRPRRSWSFLFAWRARPSQVNSRSSSKGLELKYQPERNLWRSISQITSTWQYQIWQFLRCFKSTQVRFAIKVGVGAALFALPAMIDSLRPIFVEWRLEWGLLSFFIILNSSVGGTYSAAFWRITGSALGTGLAMITWSLFPAQPYALAPLGACIAAPCMYMIVGSS